jgi:hypothetical protein
MASQSVLEILIQAVDESAAALEGTQNNLKAVAQEAITTGVQIGIMGAALTAAYGGVVTSAAGVQESQDSLKQAVTDAMSSAATSSGSYATQVQFLKDKIDGYKASIQSATATLDTHTGSAEKSAAAHAKAAATIATDQVNIAKYQAQLDILTNAENLHGETVGDVTGQLESAATANVNLGFSISDSTHSLSQAFTATKSVSEALQVNQAAMDLARAKNIDLATATNQVILAMNGQGRALATYGIQIKDGLSGMSALQAVQGAVNGQAQAYAGTLSGSLAVAMSSFNKLLSDMGSTQLPILAQLLGWVVKIIDAVDSWTQKHQKLTEYILLFVGVLGVLLTVLGTLLVVFGTIALAVLALGAPFLLLIGLVAALATIIIVNWTAIKENIEAIWQLIVGIVQKYWKQVIEVLFPGFGSLLVYIIDHLNQIAAAWNSTWGAVSSFFIGIWDGIKNALTSALDFLKSAINSFVGWANGVFQPILNVVNGIGSVATGIVSAATSAAHSAGSLLHLASGGIVSSPTLALVGEAGPEAVIPLSAFNGGSSLGGGGFGGAGNIVININGGIFSSDGAVRQIANEIARQINQSLRVRNYQN